MHAWFNSISAHPDIALTFVFLVACGESLAVVGTFVPAGVVMFAAGALIGTGALNGWVTLAVASLGAIAGDGISYELGRRYHRELRTWWVAKGREAAFARGERFVQRHGTKSIVFARFFAPVRAIVPLVVGTAQMPRRQFYPVNIGSALAWSPAHITPGIVFGASAQLAAAVSARLAVMLLLVIALVWLVVRLGHVAIERGVLLVKSGFEWVIQRFSGRHSRGTRLLLRIFDPNKPDFPTLSVLTLLFVGSIWMFLGILQDVVAHDPLVRADTTLYSFLQMLRTSPTDQLMAGLVELDGYGVGLLVTASVLIGLLIRRGWRSAVYWIFTGGVAVALCPVLERWGGKTEPFMWRMGAAHSSLPNVHATFTVVLYGFLGWLMARRQSPLWRNVVMAVIAIWVVMTGFGRLYLGESWLSGVLGGWSLGLAWFAVMAGAYTYQQVRDDIGPKSLACIVCVVLAIFGSWTIAEDLPADIALYRPRMHEIVLTLSQWTNAGWRALPARRSEISGDEEESFPLQWVASGGTIADRLGSVGWRAAPAWSAKAALLWLSPKTPVEALPVLPKLAEGTSSELVFVKFDPRRPTSRLVLRLWRSRYRLVATKARDSPIWYGAMYQESFQRRWWVVTLVTTTNWPDASAIAQLLPIGMQVLRRSATQDGVTRQVVLVFPTAS